MPCVASQEFDTLPGSGVFQPAITVSLRRRASHPVARG